MTDRHSLRDARAVARLIPERAAQVRRLLGDPSVPRRHKALLGFLIAYLASPIDLIPDFIPVIGHVDDAIVATLVLRIVLRAESRRGDSNP